MKNNIWISVSGIDGSGKTSISKFLMKILNGNKFLKFPSENWVRRVLESSGNGNPYGDVHTDSLLFALSNRLDMGKVKKLRKQSKILITQRCWLDNIPYRAVQGVPCGETLKLMGISDVPDILIHLKCRFDTAYNRIKNKNGDKYETRSFMKKLDSEYDKLIDLICNDQFGKIKVIQINADETLQNMKTSVMEKLRPVIKMCGYEL